MNPKLQTLQGESEHEPELNRGDAGHLMSWDGNLSCSSMSLRCTYEFVNAFVSMEMLKWLHVSAMLPTQPSTIGSFSLWLPNL